MTEQTPTKSQILKQEFDFNIMGFLPREFHLNFVSLVLSQNATKEFKEFNEIQITELPNFKLLKPIHVKIEPDDEGYIATTTDFPLYAFDNDKTNAIEKLKLEIESLYDDLMEDDDFTDEWLSYKKLLKEMMVSI